MTRRSTELYALCTPPSYCTVLLVGPGMHVMVPVSHSDPTGVLQLYLFPRFPGGLGLARMQFLESANGPLVRGQQIRP